jgi:hypothetical protein
MIDKNAPGLSCENNSNLNIAPGLSCAVLFARTDSIYKSIPECDVFDKKRNALSYQGQLPVICHPPCRAWGRLKGLANPEPGEKDLARFAIKKVRGNGGVLEHPAFSDLWEDQNLPVNPGTDQYGGFTVSIDQHWFGHKAKKPTWLYIVGISPNELPPFLLNFNCIDYTVGYSAARSWTYKKECPKKDREATPVKLAAYLIGIIHLINKNKNSID